MSIKDIFEHGGHSAVLRPVLLSGHLTGGYMVLPSAIPKFTISGKLRISSKGCPKIGLAVLEFWRYRT